jgi:hypothetical protein
LSGVAVVVAACAGFLLAVLWFDLMFDIQVRAYRDAALPDDVLTSISTYYRRVTTDAYPMNRLIALVMLSMLAAIVVEIVLGATPWWIGWTSLALAASGFVPTMTRTVPNARRLGGREGTSDERSVLARAIFRDHCLSFVRMGLVLGLQMTAAWLR